MKKTLFLLVFVAFYVLPGFSQQLFVPGGFTSSGIGNSSSTTNVGIGTSSPTSLLHLRNPLPFNGGDYTFMKFENRHYGALETIIAIGTSSFQPSIRLYEPGSTTQYTDIESNSAFFNGSITVKGDIVGGVITMPPLNYRIFTNGNATFNGKVTAKEIEVKPNVWSDYVFSREYDLMPINTLEGYIKVNKHLPEIPTESEVLKNGINVGEINVLLLKKIEELTLYVIQLNKENVEIRKEIKQTRK